MAEEKKGKEGQGGGGGQGGDNGQKHHIFIDEKEYAVEAKNLSGAQIKALASVPAEYQLFLERPGEDEQVADASTIKISSNMKFYSLPPATFG